MKFILTSILALVAIANAVAVPADTQVGERNIAPACSYGQEYCPWSRSCLCPYGQTLNKPFGGQPICTGPITNGSFARPACNGVGLVAYCAASPIDFCEYSKKQIPRLPTQEMRSLVVLGKS
jgi:hypothetical protein